MTSETVRLNPFGKAIMFGLDVAWLMMIDALAVILGSMAALPRSRDFHIDWPMDWSAILLTLLFIAFVIGYLSFALTFQEKIMPFKENKALAITAFVVAAILYGIFYGTR